MTRAVAHVVWVLAFAVLTLGCGSTSTTDSTDSADDPSKEPTVTTSTPATGPAAAAAADLATRLDVDPATIEVVSQEAVTWRDGSLGCAKEGLMYTQALVEGSRIILRVDETDHEYHSGGTKPPFRCELPTE